MLPIGIGLVISVREIQKQSYEQQLYALNQGYEQTSQALEDKMSRLHNISTMLAVNNMLNLSLRLTGEEKALAQQLADFESIDSYAYGMEMAFETSNIWFYIDDALPVVSENMGRYRSLGTVRQMAWYQELMNSNGTPTWVSFSENKYDMSRAYVAIARQLWDQEDYSREIGVLVVSLERDILEDMMIGAVEGQAVYVETEEGSLLAANMEEQALPRIPAGLRNEQSGSFHEVVLDGKSCMVRSQLLDRTNVYLVSVVDKERLLSTTSVANVGLVTWYLLVCLVVLAVFIPLTRSITGRLKQLKAQMMLAQDGTFLKIENAEDYADEIGQLVGRYNGMTEQVSDLLQEQYALGQEKMQLELKALQSQINPHFLYNTLENMRMSAYTQGCTELSDMCILLSKVLRYGVTNQSRLVTVREELEQLKNYTDLLHSCFPQLQIHVFADEGIMEYFIIKVIFQPLVENSVNHAVQNIQRPIHIQVWGYEENNDLVFIISDDGNGMEKQYLEELRKSLNDENDTRHGIGLKNIHRRIRLYYGENYGLVINSSPGRGTSVTVRIPKTDTIL